jgi:hypothetical protein
MVVPPGSGRSVAGTQSGRVLSSSGVYGPPGGNEIWPAGARSAPCNADVLRDLADSPDRDPGEVTM